ncbi:MAG TPA: hypothetical protein GX405_02740 [Rhizobiales bacterium]|nr:hypothetical protein [Hyphomicrobiales bacterium]
MWRAAKVCLLAFAMEVSLAGLSRADLRFNPGVTTDGFRFLIVEGTFSVEDDLANFSDAVRTYGPIAIGFNSPGGNVVKAMELGRLIRSFRLSTVQVRGLDCSSACALAFMGGVRRTADPGAIGVHKSSFSGDYPLDVHTAVAAVQQITADVVSYMIEMGVDPALLQVSLSYESDDMRYLSKSEMERYGVTSTREAGPEPSHAGPGPMTQVPTAVPPAKPAGSSLETLLVVPEARTGRVRHPKGRAALKAAPDPKSGNLLILSNGSPLRILGSADRWYRVEYANATGYMHHTWVYVDQFESGPFDQRHIQVKIFESYGEAEAYVRTATIPLAAYLATNGWFAITLDQTYPESVAALVVKKLKREQVVPSDSFMTYGNTYVRKVCCR